MCGPVFKLQTKNIFKLARHENAERDTSVMAATSTKSGTKFDGEDMPEEGNYSLQNSKSLLAAREFARHFGEVPLEPGVLCWDFMKGKTGIIQVFWLRDFFSFVCAFLLCFCFRFYFRFCFKELGHKKRKGPERVIMKCKGPRATRRHFGLPTNCVAVPETDCFYRDCLKDTWVLVKEIVLRDRAVWLRYAHVMVKENTPGAAEKTTDAAAEKTTDAAAEKTTDTAAEKQTDAADKQTDTQATAAAAAATSNGEAGAEAQTG